MTAFDKYSHYIYWDTDMCIVSILGQYTGTLMHGKCTRTLMHIDILGH